MQMEDMVACARRNVLEKCKNILFDRLNNNIYTVDPLLNINHVFLVDPLISDHQCQCHSLLLFHILSKCFDSERHTYDFEKLSEKDIEILSFGVLISILKIECEDKFGIVTRQESIMNLGGKMVLSKKQEKKFISDVKEMFNDESIQFIRRIATLNVKKILNECSASVTHNHITLHLLPCYITFYAILTHMKENNLPIIIVLTKVLKVGQCDDIQYSVTSRDILYCEWQGNTLRCKNNLNDFDKIRPAIGVTSHSIIGFEPIDEYFVSKFKKYIDGEEFPSKKFMQNCDIGHLLMISAASHFQLSESKSLVIPTKNQNRNEYTKYIFEKFSDNANIPDFTPDSRFDFNGTNIYNEFIAHHKLGQECYVFNQQYNTGEGEKIRRSSVNTFFTTTHMYVTNFLQEIKFAKKLQLNATLERNEICKFADNLAEDAIRIFELF